MTFAETVWEAMMAHRAKNVLQLISPSEAKMIIQTSYDTDPTVLAGKAALRPKCGHLAITQDCHRLYHLYPRHIAKNDALRAIAKALQKHSFEKLEHAVNRYKFCTDRWKRDERKFIPHPASWFNSGCYGDDPQEWEKGGPPKAEPAQPIAEPKGWLAFMRTNFENWIKFADGSEPVWRGLTRYEQEMVAGKMSIAAIGLTSPRDAE